MPASNRTRENADRSDRRLMARCRDGDAEAFRALFERKYRREGRAFHAIASERL